MKKIIIAVSALLLSLGAFAEVVTYDAALNTAAKFFGNIPTSQLTLAWKGDSEIPAFYAFNKADGGFVIISGETAVQPVIGYSHTKHFSAKRMPSNLTAVFKNLDKHVTEVRKARALPTELTKKRWAEVGTKTKAGTEVILTTAEWDQGAPYYNNCPTYGGSRCYTGCVATAMAILIRYNKYPANGTGTVGGYKTDSYNISVPSFSIASHTYNYDNMPLQYTSSATSVQNSAVAQLMYDCGASVYMDYTPSGSGAYTEDQLTAMYTNFGYSKALKYLKKDGYTVGEWLSIIRKEINAKRPMLCSSADTGGEGGHAFVLDGYDSEDNVHVNWGWGGEDNGFYTTNLSVSGYTFNLGTDLIVNLIPDDGTTTTPLVLFGENISTSSTITKGSNFSVSVKLYNNANNTFSGYLNLRLVDKKGNVKQSTLCSDKSFSLQTGYEGTLSLTAKITEDIAFGDRVIPIVKTASSDWEKLGFDLYPYEDAIGVSSLPCYDYNVIDIPSVITAGDRIELKLARSSSYTEVTWYYDGQKTTDPTVKVTAGSHTIKAVLGTGETIIQKLTVK